MDGLHQRRFEGQGLGATRSRGEQPAAAESVGAKVADAGNEAFEHLPRLALTLPKLRENEIAG